MTHCENYFAETAQIAAALAKDLEVERLVKTLVEVRGRAGRVFLAGLGGSAANCSHAANDFRKLAGIDAIAMNDNVSELTARANDEGFGSIYSEAMEASNATYKDALLVLSVGGGSGEVSQPLVRAVMKAKQLGMEILGVVGRDGGYVRQNGDCVVLIPNLEPARVTPHTEGFQMVVLHCLVSHPDLQRRATKW